VATKDNDGAARESISAVLARLPTIQASIQEARQRAELGESITHAQLARQFAELDEWLGDLAAAIAERRVPGSDLWN
jgi:hypothetical protein